MIIVTIPPLSLINSRTRTLLAIKFDRIRLMRDLSAYVVLSLRILPATLFLEPSPMLTVV